jgi:hypothetical protein
MAAVPAENVVAGPADSLEVRWILPGPVGPAVRDWFGRFPAGAESREDIYLVRPPLRGLSVKLRDGRVLDVKSCLDSRAVSGLPVSGRVESWRKWSFSYDPDGHQDAAPAGWVAVRKQRRSTWFPLAAGPAVAARPAAQAGCAVELTEFHVRDDRWWTVGFEAKGPAGLLAGALWHAADLVFAGPLPGEAEFTLDNSRSYAQWLARRPGPR